MANHHADTDHKKQQQQDMLNKNLILIIHKEDTIKKKLAKSHKLERFTTDIALFISLIKDYYQGNYRSIPYKSISIGIIGLLYILNPIDIIPDVIPIIGYIDDALMLAFCLKTLEEDLQKYQQWQQAHSTVSGHTNSATKKPSDS